MSNPSSYLESTLARRKERNSFIRRDAHLILEGVAVKGLLLDELRHNVERHRLEDLEQLAEARRQTWVSWEHQFKRIESWLTTAANLQNAAANLLAWRTSAQGFDRAGALAQKFVDRLDHKAAALEQRVTTLVDKMFAWSDRLRGMEAELREFAERQAAKGTDIVVSRARKQPYLDFIYIEREEEGRLAVEIKTLRTSVNRALDRLARADGWVNARAAVNNGLFEGQKSVLLELWRWHPEKYNSIRDTILQEALGFEDSRRRLRWIYEQIQKMRVVEDAKIGSARRPLLERLFNRDSE